WFHQPLVVQHCALDEVLAEDRGSPAAELSSTWPLHAVAHGEDGVEVEVLHIPSDLATAFLTNCQGFLDSCPFVEFAFRKDVPEMQADILLGGGEELGNLSLGKPDRFVSHAEPDGDSAILSGVQD